VISYLASVGADPNISTASALFRGVQSSTILHHLFSTFHPMAVGITCIIPLDITRFSAGERSVFNRSRVANGAPRAIGAAQVRDIIHQVNRVHKHASAHRILLPFLMGTHPRVGAASAVRAFIQSRMCDDSNLLDMIWQYVFIPLPHRDMMEIDEHDVVQRE
jgi:hypothetical protein